MKLFSKVIFTLTFIIFQLHSFAMDSTCVKINFDSLLKLPLNKFTIWINDGIYKHKVIPKSETYWKGELFSPFGFVEIEYHNSDTSITFKKFFFKKGNCSIYIDKTSNRDTLHIIPSINLVSYDIMGGSLLDSFAKKDYDTLIHFYRVNRKRFGKDPMLIHKTFLLGDTLNYRKIEFIKQYPDSYIAFWIFATDIVKLDLFKPDSLMNIYNNVLTDKYKNSKAASYLVSLIKNKIAIASNSNFPNFSVSDLKGNTYDLQKFKGKFLLLQFWASWCAPCLEEVPHLKEINNKYKNKDFRILSISIDKDSIAFQKTVKKYSMDWTQIYGDTVLFNSLGWGGVPQIYLIDKAGHVIYNSTMIKDLDLDLLRNLLSEKLDR